MTNSPSMKKALTHNTITHQHGINVNDNKQWLDEMENELIDVTTSIETELNNELLMSNNNEEDSDSTDDNSNNSLSSEDRKIRNRMMKLYVTIAKDDDDNNDHDDDYNLKSNNNVSKCDSQSYYTIVDSNNNQLNDINQSLLHKLNDKEIAQLKKLMLTRELSQPWRQQQQQVRSDDSTSDTILRDIIHKYQTTEKSKPIHDVQNLQMSDRSIDKMMKKYSCLQQRHLERQKQLSPHVQQLLQQEKQQRKKEQERQLKKKKQHTITKNLKKSKYLHSKDDSNISNTSETLDTRSVVSSNSDDSSSVTVSTSSCSTVTGSIDVEAIDNKTKELKARMIELKKKYEYLRIKRLIASIDNNSKSKSNSKVQSHSNANNVKQQSRSFRGKPSDRTRSSTMTRVQRNNHVKRGSMSFKSNTTDDKRRKPNTNNKTKKPLRRERGTIPAWR